MGRKRESDKRRGVSRPVAAGPEIAVLLGRLGGRPQMAGLPGLWRNWDCQMGDELCAIAWPAGHKKDILLLGCADSCAMQEARMRAPEYVRLANAWLGSEFFREARPYLNRPDLRCKDSPSAGACAKKKVKSSQKTGDAIKKQASGRFLADMAADSPVARCYAMFCRHAGSK